MNLETFLACVAAAVLGAGAGAALAYWVVIPLMDRWMEARD